ncbi:Hypothetical predicted protein [Olea europaea subsp. europaea]|uniref:Uncharacterized protein n=1 Tax=Olea europaea subsp. europaea TaxID=158383 RepID=A0A8S0PA07_OLEEU|nr:Hypothetical predicted protein [Olea europaea subsp. europaea]
MSSFPCSYLGAPISPGRVSYRDFEPLITKIRKKMDGWKGALLSAERKLILVRRVLSSMPIHLMMVIAVLEKVIHQPNVLLSNFLCGQGEFGPKKHWIAWKKIGRPTGEGGIGV